MAIIKCKMCGGELVLIEGQSVAECEYCGSRQTVPAADDEKKLIQFERAERLRKNCEFDKAAGLYEAIVADFRQEAEAYWGLVLCKYGIEYVDDPATGKKIPTCHRSSFDSIMEDSDFEQTLENADAAARRVYREEAKQIEEIRKGIIAVSANEAPYDIFICYKETDEKGQRTLDSVLAQDVYDMLTEKGYRVFFSRITLEDKLGVEFEPYIFAALNSAKIMLAFGTDYEYFNAVWVKNEWSRFLKLMAKDKGKHLIPCFKGIDAYDMPKEFAKLQAQDLGKLGAMQDLLRGIEKLLPKQVSNTTVIQEKVVVGGSGGSNKIASLLDRGNMALEDGDWAKADSFFEDVLNNDSKNAQAYIGKTLAQEKCRTMDALVRKRKDAHQSVRAETLYIKERVAHINDAAARFRLPGYVEEGNIRKLYSFERGYSSEVAGRQKQYREEEGWWQNHKLLARAEKFATGAVAEHLQNEKKHLFAQLNERVKKAQEAEARAVSKLEAQYDAALAEADKRAEQLYNDGLARREADYQNWLEKAKRETEPETLKTLAGCFDRLRDYQDSRNLAEHCRKRAAEEQAKIEAEKAQKAEEARRQAAAQRKRQKTIAMIVMPVAIAVIVFLTIWSTVIVPNGKYKDAVALMEVGKYEEAIAAFETLDGYQDSAEKISECNTRMLDAQYDAAAALMEAGNYEEAAAAFAALQGYRDSGELLAECRYQQAVALENAGDIVLALRGFTALRDYKDANGRTDALRKTYQLCLQRETVSAGYQHTVALKGDGTVVAVGDNTWGACNVSDWTDIVAISAGGNHTVGLKADGTVVAVGYNQSGQCNVSDWSDIIAIRVGAAHTVGLKADGTVVAVGDNREGQCNVSDWTDIIAIGTGVSHTVGLRADGTVVAVGYEKHGGCNVSGWSDIIAISAGRDYTVGLKADGTVVATKYSGDDYIGQCDVSDWTGIIAISTYDNHTVGLKADGTVVAVGQNFTGQCEVSGWTEIVAISTGTAHTVGLRTDGTVVAVGYNNKGQRDTNGWTGIKLP